MINDILNTNWNEIVIVIERSIFSFITLFLITKLIGKKQVSELNLFDYVISISIGNFAAEMTMNLDIQFLNGFFGVLIFGIIATIVSILTVKSIILRRFFIGEPTIILENGKFIYNNLKRNKLDINDFLQAARAQGYFDINEIKFALMEANGAISFMPKEDYAPVINKNMKLTVNKQGLCSNIIIDGKLMEENLTNINKDKNWLDKQLKIYGYNGYDNILLAYIDLNEKLTIYDKNYNSSKLNVLE